MMIFSKNLIFSTVLLLALVAQSCKTKKIIAPPAPPVAVAAPAASVPPPPPPAPPKEEPPLPPAAPNYKFSNIQFEFNSAVLKTSAYARLDEIATEIKKDGNAKFVINGHSSAEGTAAHNQSLSEDRANAVKGYLMNAGANGANLEVKGWGESKPLTNNTNEEGRGLNRRVEVVVIQ